ncbi:MULTISPECIES: hypothetical protein [unclassified Candidatus Cardinium]|uniref:hypothetical protein n=1 Tax=unclassified Candidatus Cardinium TaxID=2641185 RepID=UPI001FB43422|nr:MULTISPECIES: hypothetical protein [unclassified Candidatus Cardinium]
MKTRFLTRQQLSIVIANGLIHFDNALYGYLVPIIAPLFFPKSTPVVQLIGGYSFLIISFLAKPLGLLFFSKIAQATQETKALRYTLLGVSISLITMSALPIYENGALWSIFWLLLARVCAEASAAGEDNIAKIYLLQGLAMPEAKKLAGFYEGSTMVGILSAGAVGTSFTWMDEPTKYWRLPFLIAAVATLLNLIFFRLNTKPKAQHYKPMAMVPTIPLYQQLWQARNAIMRIAIVAGFSYIAYTIPFIFISSFVPMVTKITYATMMQYAPILMLLDILFISWIAKVGQKCDHNNLMAVASGLFALSIIPLFSGLPGASIFYVTAVRSWLIFLGVVFSCFLTIWSKEQVATTAPYITIGLATVLGSSLFGKSATAICFYLFHKYHTPIAPACYIALIAFAATLIMADSASA